MKTITIGTSVYLTFPLEKFVNGEFVGTRTGKLYLRELRKQDEVKPKPKSERVLERLLKAAI